MILQLYHYVKKIFYFFCKKMNKWDTSSLIEAMLTITQDSTKMDMIQIWAINDEVSVTCVLIYQAGFGALGYQAELGLINNFDFSNVLGWSNPNYCYCR